MTQELSASSLRGYRETPTARMTGLIARAPTRLDFGGGWTDVPPYSDEEGGFVCNIALARYATVRLRASDDAAGSIDTHRATDTALAEASRATRRDRRHHRRDCERLSARRRARRFVRCGRRGQRRDRRVERRAARPHRPRRAESRDRGRGSRRPGWTPGSLRRRVRRCARTHVRRRDARPTDSAVAAAEGVARATLHRRLHGAVPDLRRHHHRGPRRLPRPGPSRAAGARRA